MYYFNNAGHPSWVSRAHSSLPLWKIYLPIDRFNQFRTNQNQFNEKKSFTCPASTSSIPMGVIYLMQIR